VKKVFTLFYNLGVRKISRELKRMKTEKTYGWNELILVCVVSVLYYISLHSVFVRRPTLTSSIQMPHACSSCSTCMRTTKIVQTAHTGLRADFSLVTSHSPRPFSSLGRNDITVMCKIDFVSSTINYKVHCLRKTMERLPHFLCTPLSSVN
jgi:hypothetical protein